MSKTIAGFKMKLSIQVEGLKELDEALGELDKDLRGKALYPALNYASSPMLKEAKQRAALAKEPHEMEYQGQIHQVKPGLLKSAIRRKRVKARYYQQGAAVMIYVGRGTKQKLYPRYWHFIENGTRKMPATPFLRPAFDTHKDEAVERFKKKLGERIEKFNTQ
ncbi:HK97-gp10 family putative phage morphogenesis protein [Moraxella sp.]|uniref:HK97-gp10 family putative phage morphogenesis protein n=1 Tax=Moraxella sp. TaxID=479 RepID=UPI0026DC3119|nr:HK97-gp10 family putative phage morphogenesis protein [Moraxella sp.]MDO4895014.1 HK97 gp10 family phage protein [Moraxella sp.]